MTREDKTILIVLWTISLIMAVCVLMTEKKEDHSYTCRIEENKLRLSHCFIKWELDWTKQLSCRVRKNWPKPYETIYTKWNCYTNDTTWQIQLYNDYWVSF